MSTPLPLLHNVLETLSNQQHNNHRIPLMCLLLHRVTVLSWLILSVLIGASKVVLVDQTLLPMLEMWETWVLSLGQEDSLEKGMATHSSILAWRISWTEEPGYSPWGCKESDTTGQLTLFFWLNTARIERLSWKKKKFCPQLGSCLSLPNLCADGIKDYIP